MKAHLQTSSPSVLSLILCAGLFASCAAEVQEQEEASTSEEASSESQESSAEPTSQEGAVSGQAEAAPMNDAEARRAKFQAELEAKMAARLKDKSNNQVATPETGAAMLFDAEGHLVDKHGNHIDKTLPADKPVKGSRELVNPPALGNNEGPRLTFEIGKEKHDFGKLLQGMVAEHEFTLSSSGTESLIIRQVKPTCGCTVAQVYYEGDAGERLSYIYGNPIPANKKIWIPAKLHTKGKRGHQNTRINITSTDPRGQTQLGIEADIDPFFLVMPSYLNFGQIRKGEVKTLELNISTVKNEALAMSISPASVPAGVTVDLQPTGAVSGGRSPSWKLKATVGPDLVEGNLARTLMVMSDKVIEGGKPNPDGSEAVFQVSVSLSARVVGPFSFNPPYMSMGLVRPGQVLSRSVRLTCHDEGYDFAEHPPVVEIKGIAPANQPYPDWIYAERFTPRVTPVPGENAVDVELTCQGMPETLSGSFRGTLIVGLAHEEKSEVIIPITGVCRGGVVAPRPSIKPAGGK